MAQAAFWAALGLAVAFVIAVVVGRVGPGFRRTGDGEPLPVLGAVPDFSLTERSGRTVGSSDLRGRIWVANLIFTRCPSLCPRLSEQMAALQRALAPSGEDQDRPDPESGSGADTGARAAVRLVSISVDPANDTAEVLRRYADRFRADPERWIFLTGSRLAVEQLVRDGFRLSVVELPAGERETATGPIAHSDRFVVVDPDLRIRGYFPGTDEDVVGQVMGAIVRLSQEMQP